MKQEDDFRQGLRNGVASMLANILEHSLHPLDVVKVRLQSHDGQAKGNVVPAYSRVSTALTTIFREEGIRGLYKGILTTLVATNISKFVYFGLYGYRKNAHHRTYGDNASRATTFAAMEAGFITTTMTAPLWIVKTRLILNTKHHTAVQPTPIQSIYKQHGATGFFRGLHLSLLLSFHGVIQMTFYERFKLILNYKPGNDSRETVKPFICGAGSKLIATTVMFPVTLVRTRIHQNQYHNGQDQPKYKNTLDILDRTWKTERLRGFYKGYAANIIRSAPSSAIFFFFFEFFKKHIPF